MIQKIICWLAFHKMYRIAWTDTEEVIQCPRCMSTASINHLTRQVKVWKS